MLEIRLLCRLVCRVMSLRCIEMGLKEDRVGLNKTNNITDL